MQTRASTSAWRAMIEEPERFINAIKTVSMDIATWNINLETVYSAENGVYSFEVGFATFFINRTSRSGVILGSGPIGGYDQSGKWKIDARFNRTSLIEKIQALVKICDKITLSNLDALDFAADYLVSRPGSNISFH